MSDLSKDHSFGGWLRHFRIKKKVTLRSASKLFEMDPGNLSKIERSELGPPDCAFKIKALCSALKLGKHEFELLSSLAFQYHLARLQRRFYR